MRTLVQWGICLLIVAAVSETFLIQGLVIPCRVVSGSMAGTLLGVHRDVVCADCGYRFSCGTDQRPVPARAVCPNCGYAANSLENRPDLDGHGVWIDRTAFALRWPRRWEVVAIRRPGQAGEILVKRIVGLPGEAVEIRDGDVYVDGQIQRKNLAEQHALAIPVYDADFPPTLEPASPPRWRPDTRESHWRSIGGRFTHPVGPDDGPVDWLVYHHCRRLPPNAPPLQRGGLEQPSTIVESPVTDVCGYNQSQPRREEDTHAVADLLLCFRLEPVGNGTIYVRATDGGEAFETRLTPMEKEPQSWHYQAFRAGKLISGAGGTTRLSGRPLVEVSLVDQQFLLALDGRTAVAWPYQRPEPPAPSSMPLAIGVQGLGVTVRDLRIYRDVYYTHPIGLPTSSSAARPVRLAAGEYFVLGDNSPISEDSRNWPGPAAVNANLLVGKPLVSIGSIPLSPWPGWLFQVPNPAAIQYIH